MNKDSIKKGTLVKAWDDYESVYFIDWYDRVMPNGMHVLSAYSYPFKNAIPIPDSLVRQLERLGSNKCTNKAGEFNCGDVEQGIGVVLCDECQGVFDKHIKC